MLYKFQTQFLEHSESFSGLQLQFNLEEREVQHGNLTKTYNLLT